MEERMPVFEYNSSKAGIVGNENVKTSQIQPMTKGVLKKHPTLVAADYTLACWYLPVAVLSHFAGAR